MNFKSAEELKSFILWAKKQQIEELTADGVTVRFSQLAFVPGLTAEGQDEVEQALAEYKPNSKTWTEEPASEEDEELLFWSAQSN